MVPTVVAAAVSEETGPQRRRLTDEQRYVLNEAAFSHPLAVVLNGWAPPSPDWNSKARYVPRLAAAAEALARSGLIDVYEEHTGIGEPALLLRDEAVEAVGNLANWWQEDDEDDAAVVSDDVTFYSIASTDEGRDALAACGGPFVPWAEAIRTAGAGP